MYLNNTTNNIRSFSISDGYNLLLYNIGKQHQNGTISKIGIRIIIAHPDIIINDRERFWMDGDIGGAYFAGFAGQYSTLVL